MSSVLIQKLDELKAAIAANSVPYDRRWGDSETVAAMLDVSVGHFRDRIASRTDFPKPRFAHGHPRYRLSEVDEWMEHQTTKYKKTALK